MGNEPAQARHWKLETENGTKDKVPGVGCQVSGSGYGARDNSFSILDCRFSIEPQDTGYGKRGSGHGTWDMGQFMFDFRLPIFDSHPGTRETSHGAQGTGAGAKPRADRCPHPISTHHPEFKRTVHSPQFIVRIKNALTVNCRLSTVNFHGQASAVHGQFLGDSCQRAVWGHGPGITFRGL